MGYNDLGDYYYQKGDLSTALKCYTKPKQYCTSFKHLIQLFMSGIKVLSFSESLSSVISFPFHFILQLGIELGSYTHVTNFIANARDPSDTKEDVSQSFLFLFPEIQTCSSTTFFLKKKKKKTLS